MDFQGDFCLETLLISVPDSVHASVQSTAQDISAHLQRAIVLNYKCGYLLHSALHHYQLLCFMQRLRVTFSSAEDAEKLC